MALAERRYRRNRIVRFNRQPVQTVSAFPRLHPKGTSSRVARRAPRRPLASSQWQSRRLSAFFIFQSSGFIHFRAPPLQRTPRQGAKKLRSFDRSFMLALPIFPCSHPQSIVGANELNFCVRDGNRCTLTAINTNYLSVFRLLPENVHHYTTARLPCQALFW